jgi:ABC-type uncharacterized transport system ATPase component
MGLGVLSLGEQQINAIADNAIAKAQGAGAALESNAQQIVKDAISQAVSEVATQLEDPLLTRIDAISSSVKQLVDFVTALQGLDVNLKMKGGA